MGSGTSRSTRHAALQVSRMLHAVEHYWVNRESLKTTTHAKTVYTTQHAACLQVQVLPPHLNTDWAIGEDRSGLIFFRGSCGVDMYVVWRLAWAACLRLVCGVRGGRGALSALWRERLGLGGCLWCRRRLLHIGHIGGSNLPPACSVRAGRIMRLIRAETSKQICQIWVCVCDETKGRTTTHTPREQAHTTSRTQISS
jgi:hypothetical protein